MGNAPFQSDFTKHMKAAGDAHAAGNMQVARHHLSNALKSTQVVGNPGSNAPANKTGATKGKDTAENTAGNPSPTGFGSPTVTRGFGPGKQFARGRATGTPKPKIIDGQTPPVRGLPSSLKGFSTNKT